MTSDRAELIAECKRIRARIARREADRETIRILTEALFDTTIRLHAACELWRHELEFRLASERGWHEIMGHKGWERV